MNNILKEMSENHYDNDNYTLVTINNALRTNIKQKDKEFHGLEKKYNRLLKLLSSINLSHHINTECDNIKFEKSLLKKMATRPIESHNPDLTKSLLKILKLMKDSGITLQDLMALSHHTTN